MAENVAQTFVLDVSQTVKNANTAADAIERLGDVITTTAVEGQGNLSKLAAAQVEYSNKLAAAAAEQRAARAAAAEMTAELRRLATVEREIIQEGRKSTAVEDRKRLTRELEKNREAQLRIADAIDQSKAAQQQATASINASREARRLELNAAKQVAAAGKEALVTAKAQERTTQQAVLAARQLAKLKDARFEKNFLGDLKAQEEALGKLKSKYGDVNTEVSSLGTTLSKAAAYAAGFFVLDGIAATTSKIVNTRIEFDRLESVLTSSFLGDSAKAKRALFNVQGYALETGQDVESLTDSFAKLVTRGIEPTRRQLGQLGDFAKYSGKSIDQLVEGILDAQTNEFLRLREFGIIAKQSGDKVAFTFKGVTTEVEKSSTAISEYLFGLGDLPGVVGSASAQADKTGGAISRLTSSVALLYNTIGQNDGVMVKFINRLTRATQAVTEYFKSTNQKAIEASATGIGDYSTLLDSMFKQAADVAKKGGQDVNAAVAAVADQQALVLQKQLVDTNKQLGDIAKRDYLTGRSIYEGNALKQADVLAATTRKTLLEGEIKLIKERQAAFSKADKTEADELGLIEALRKKIADETKVRDESKDRKEIHRINLQIIADNKELDALLEKQNGRRKQESDRLAAALRALQQERLTLLGLAEKAEIKASADAKTRADEQLQADLRGIELVKQKLIEREKAVRKAGGRGGNADGVIDGVQQQQLDILTEAAQRKHADEITRADIELYEKLQSLRADSNEKEQDLVNSNYDKQVVAAAGNAKLVIAIEEARGRDLLKLRADQEQKRIEQEAELGRTNATVIGETFGQGTGTSIFEAKRAEQQKLLDIEKKAAQDSLNNTLNKTGEAATIERNALRAQLLRIQNQQKALDKEEARAKFSIYKLVLGENDSQELRDALDQVATSVATSFAEIAASQAAAAQARAANATTAISELGTQIQAEIALNKDGAASNIGTLQAEIQEQKRIRREALEEQRKAAQLQVVIDTLTQASSITTAAANVFAAFSAIPFIGVPLGIAAAGTLIGAFITAKVKAYDAASQIGKNPGFFKGGYTGGSDTREERGPVHGKEFVFDNEKTRKHRPFFELLHSDKPLVWSDPALNSIRPLLMPDPSLPGKMQAAQAQVQQLQVNHSFSPLQAGLDQMSTKIGALEQHVARIPKLQVYQDEHGNLVKEDPITGSRTIYRKQKE